MDDKPVSGPIRQAKGSVREAIGKLTGNAKVEAHGAAEKLEGEAQAAREAARRVSPDDAEA